MHKLDVQAVINTSAYDAPMVCLIKRIAGKENLILERKPESEEYQNLVFQNQNYQRSIFYYFCRVFFPGIALHMEGRHLLLKYATQLKNSDLIHAHWGWPVGAYAEQISAELHKKFCITFHGSDINRIGKRSLPRLLKAMTHSSACFFVSEQLLSAARARGYRGDQAHVSYNGVNTDLFDPANFPPHDEHVQTLGYIGAVREVKGVKRLPDIFSSVRERLGESVRFLVVGEGNLLPWLQDACLQKGLQVEFAGAVQQEDVPRYLSRMDALVVPSVYEGLGMVILEANAMGIPAVGTKTGGIPEAIGYPENVIEQDDQLVMNMANRVVDLLSGKTPQPLYRQRVMEQFSWEEAVRREMAVYSQICKPADTKGEQPT